MPACIEKTRRPRLAAAVPVLAGLFLMAGTAARANDDAILASCKHDLRLSDSGCACVLEKVHSELNEAQFAFFVASVSGDVAGQQKAQMQLTGEDMQKLAMFMTTTPQQCQNQ